jgi:SAM-dependent methyltransferase
MMPSDENERGPAEMLPEVLGHYDRYEESGRLASGLGLLERLRTQELLLRFLPEPPARIYDVGGGPGVYASWLAGAGYDVHLVDPVRRHADEAREAARERQFSVAVGDARTLPFPDESAEALLLLGPLYHLPEAADRRRALSEAHRVLRPGGVVAAAGISRYASAIDGLDSGFDADPAFRAIVAEDLATGRHHNPTDEIAYFTSAFFHRPGELANEVSAAGFSAVRVYAVEGVGWAPTDLQDRLDDLERRRLLLDLLRSLETEQELMGASPHLLAIGLR